MVRPPSFRPQASAVTVRTRGLAAIACQHYTILYLIEVFLNHAEEIVDRSDVAAFAPFFRTVPEQVAFGLREVGIRAVDREVRVMSYEIMLPFAHFLAAPAHHGVVVDRSGWVGHHKALVYAHHFAEALASGACSHGIVEVEHHVRRFGKGHAVGFKPGAEVQTGWC